MRQLLIALLLVCGMESKAQLLPNTPDTLYTSRVPNLILGDWEGFMGIATDNNDVIQTNQFVLACDPTNSIPNSALVMPTDGITDCYPALQTAVTNIANGTVRIPSGVYYFSKGVTVGSNNVFIMGNGSSGPAQTVFWSSNATPTIIKFSSRTDTTLGSQLYLSNNCVQGQNWWCVPLGTTGTAGTWKFAINNHSGFLYQNLSFIITGLYPTNLICSNGWASESVLKVTNLTSQTVFVGTNFGTNGPLVFFTNADAFVLPFMITNGASAYPIETPLTSCGVQGIHFVNYYTNTVAANGLGTIMYDACQNSFCRDVEIDDTTRDGIFVVEGYKNQYQDIYLRRSSYVNSGEGYGLHFFGQDFGCIFENFIVYGYRHGLIAESGDTCVGWAYGMAIACNDVDNTTVTGQSNWCMNDITLHTATTSYALGEGLVVHHPTWGDIVHGSGGLLGLLFHCVINHSYTNITAFAGLPVGETNQYWGLGAPQRPFTYQINQNGVSVEATNNYMSVMGCVMDTPTATIFGGNYYAPATPATNYCFRFGWGFAGNGGEGSFFSGDLQPSNTFISDDNYSFLTGTNQWYNGPHAVRNSAYLTNAGAIPPGWWYNYTNYSPGANAKWPPVTPEVNGHMYPLTASEMLPAVIKWYGPWSNNYKFALTLISNAQYVPFRNDK